MFKVYYKDTRTKSVNICSLSTYFRPFSTVCIVDLEQVNVCWSIFAVGRYVKKVTGQVEWSLYAGEHEKPTNTNFLASSIPVGNYMFKVIKRNTRARCEIFSKLPERCSWCRSGVIIVNFEHMSHLGLVFLLLSLSR